LLLIGVDIRLDGIVFLFFLATLTFERREGGLAVSFAGSFVRDGVAARWVGDFAQARTSCLAS
jgi:hypothetical protein